MQRPLLLTVLTLALVLAGVARAEVRPMPTGPMPPPEAVAIASEAAGKPVSIHCTSFKDWAVPDDIDQDISPTWLAAYAPYGGREMTIRWDYCQGLLLLLDDPAGVKPPLSDEPGLYGSDPWERGDPTQWEALSWGFVLHEAQHLRGIVDETDADCNQLALLPGVLARLGVPPERAARMLQLAVAAHDARPWRYRRRPCGAAPPLPVPAPAPAPAPTPAPTPTPVPPAGGGTASPSDGGGGGSSSSTGSSSSGGGTATTPPAAPEPPVQSVPVPAVVPESQPTPQTVVVTAGPPAWSIYVTSGPVAPQTIPYLTQGLAARKTLVGPAV